MFIDILNISILFMSGKSEAKLHSDWLLRSAPPPSLLQLFDWPTSLLELFDWPKLKILTDTL